MILQPLKNQSEKIILDNSFRFQWQIKISSHCFILFSLATEKFGCNGCFQGVWQIENGKFEVNRRSVISCNAMKGGGEVLSDFFGIMNLPPPLAPASYARHLKFVAQSGRQEAELIMNRAAEGIRKCILKKSPNAGKRDFDGAIPVAVSIDCTWQKRGFTSKYGVVIAILVDTGEVVNLEVLSLHCHECRKRQHDDKSSQVYKQWEEKHSKIC